MDLPVSDYDDESSSSSESTGKLQDLRLEEPMPDQDLGSERDYEDSIKEQEVKTKVTMAASMVLSKLPSKTNDLVANLSKPKKDKVTIRFQPIGSVPHISPKVFKISSSQPFSTLIRFLEKRIRQRQTEDAKVNALTGGTLFCYIHNSIAPSPDEMIGNLFTNFNVNNELMVSYCNTVAFG
ncbi:unnamed protein product [Kuraishia capsulata CBS 1993]|uniref:Ubiquitin-like protein ATG12 n=1 Tax=Kuraishia capsulata CBS 1993 TaxID=1382522 RepID=W6MVI3_9ASCO|nr:uncharacterized protein KUCA_T00002276001 [Kuraishia capsulata CBS 1993]CDK26305.1 unnamed protein product [Kuraishia capsulata CBS 1993]